MVDPQGGSATMLVVPQGQAENNSRAAQGAQARHEGCRKTPAICDTPKMRHRCRRAVRQSQLFFGPSQRRHDREPGK